MSRRLRERSHDERGMMLVFVGLGFMAFLSASLLAIDVWMFMTARSEAQNSADAGALAGAVALVFDNWSDRSSGGAAVQNAITAATANQVMSDAVSVTPGDVTFPVIDQVKVDVFRTGDRDNPLGTLLGVYFGVPTADVEATATAEAALANAATCIKPWAVPDRWEEVQTPGWDLDDTFDICTGAGKGKGGGGGGGCVPMPDPDVYEGTGSEYYTGFVP